MRLVMTLLLLATLLPLSLAGAAEPAAITWCDLPGVDGKQHSLDDLADREVVIICVTCNHCPIALEYFERLKEFATEHCGKDDKAALVAVSVSHLETDKLDRMKVLAERQGFNFPYFYDESQAIGKALSATHTPQFFVLNRDRTLVYRGAWDDNLNPARVRQRYVEDAVSALLADRSPPVAETRATGCLIRYRR